MKKILSLIMIAVLFVSCVLPARSEDQPEKQTESGFVFNVRQTAAGPVLTDLLYSTIPNDNTIYIPKALGGVTLKPENISGRVFRYSFYAVTAFRVDEDNEWFTVVDHALYTKDGKTGLVFPDTSDAGSYSVPDGTQTLANYGFPFGIADCIRIPASAQRIYGSTFYGKRNFLIAAEQGTAAEKFAVSQKIDFIALGDGHLHKYFSKRIVPTCVDEGLLQAICPCGDVLYRETLPPDPKAHAFTVITDENGWRYGPCRYCGAETIPDECACDCHLMEDQRYDLLQNILSRSIDVKTLSRVLFYYVRLFVWRVLGVHQYCTCGARHY